MADAIIAALIASPLLITILLKSNAANSFLALCAGFVAISFAGSDLKDLTGQLNFSIDSSLLNILVLALPLLFTLLFTRKSFSGNFKLFLNCVIALSAGALLTLISVPILNSMIDANFADSKVWENLQKFQASIIGVGVFLSLVLVWAKGLKKSKDKSKKHK
jgi:hypothetical protein